MTVALAGFLNSDDMCFSTEASFIAGAVLTTTGVVAMKKAEARSLLPFAAIPFLFAIQQLTEGFEWLSFHGRISESWQVPTMYIFLLFAQVIWPAWVPYAVFKSESDPLRLKLMLPFLIGGIALGAYHLYCLITYTVTAEVINDHIAYRLEYIHFNKTLTQVVYLATAVVPPFLSSNRRIQVVGLANFISLLATYIFYRDYLLSVWCYFAALISVTVLWAVYPRNETIGELNAGPR